MPKKVFLLFLSLFLSLTAPVSIPPPFKTMSVGLLKITVGLLGMGIGIVGDGFVLNELYHRKLPLGPNHPLVHGAFYTALGASACTFLLIPGIQNLKKLKPKWFKNFSISIPGASI